MSYGLIIGPIIGLGVTIAVGHTLTGMVEEIQPQRKEAAFTINATQDVQNCKLELVADAAVTGGVHTQESASAAVAECVVSAGTVLSVQMNPNGRDFTLTATNAGAPNHVVVSDTAAGGAVTTVEK
ncbi:hypothetical protein ASH00_15745 [Arthrobacter sp. Soil782]|uniref:hypothetical protein n=1 Tax=Arthrobacter sp. Soil782 TaxID=1736410 RepID=UPI0006F31984|nr:hypothetical protein [Arthrobacter sp. Soil782]KRF03237.1 hypothetical protein ASH00_15745 [Arthrobacter sp. Soil782]